MFCSRRVFQGPEEEGNRQQFRGVGKMGGVWARYPLLHRHIFSLA